MFIVLILRSSFLEPDVPVGAWIKDLKNYDAKRGAADLSVKNANHEVFGQALIIFDVTFF